MPVTSWVRRERTITALPRKERLALLLGLLVVGLGVSSHVPLPSPVLAFRPPGAVSILSITLSPVRQVSLVVALLVCALVDGIMGDDGHLTGAGLARVVPFWILPALLTLAAFTLCEGLSAPLLQALGVAGSALALGLVVVAQLHTLDPEDPWFWPARLGLNAVAYGLALGAFFLAQALPSRSLLATPLVAAAGTLLALHLLQSGWSSPRRTWGSAALVGLLMAEVAWALSPGVASPLVASFLLLVVFYGLTGVLQQHYWGRLERRVAVEFVAVAALALAFLLKLAH